MAFTNRAVTVPNEGLGMLALDHVIPAFNDTNKPDEPPFMNVAVTTRPLAEVATEVQPMGPPGAVDRTNIPLLPVLL